VFSELSDHTLCGTSLGPPTGSERYLPQQVRRLFRDLVVDSLALVAENGVVDPKAPLAKCGRCPFRDRPFVAGSGPPMTDRVGSTTACIVTSTARTRRSGIKRSQIDLPSRVGSTGPSALCSHRGSRARPLCIALRSDGPRRGSSEGTTSTASVRLTAPTTRGKAIPSKGTRPYVPIGWCRPLTPIQTPRSDYG
jgi:hypothetical protein